jgi:hypothetical protein
VNEHDGGSFAAGAWSRQKAVDHFLTASMRGVHGDDSFRHVATAESAAAMLLPVEPTHVWQLRRGFLYLVQISAQQRWRIPISLSQGCAVGFRHVAG